MAAQSFQRIVRIIAACAVVSAAWLGACSPSDELGFERSIPAPRPIENIEETLGPGRAVRLFASSAERFGLATPGATNGLAFEYATPQGWSERPSTELRSVNFQVGESGASECYVTVLGGDGGGALANINRWCGQIGAKVWGPAELAAAPRLAMFGADAIVVALGEQGAERMLLGALAQLDGRSVFVKLGGPRAEVLTQRAAFEEFCSSLSRKP